MSHSKGRLTQKGGLRNFHVKAIKSNPYFYLICLMTAQLPHEPRSLFARFFASTARVQTNKRGLGNSQFSKAGAGKNGQAALNRSLMTSTRPASPLILLLRKVDRRSFRNENVLLRRTSVHMTRSLPLVVQGCGLNKTLNLYPQFYIHQYRCTSSDRRPFHCKAYIDPGSAQQPGVDLGKYSLVMKFGGSSVATSQRMREVAEIVLAFHDDLPILVLSAMGRTTNNLLDAGELALKCDNSDEVAKLVPIVEIRARHMAAMRELHVDSDTIQEINKLLDKMEQLCIGIALMQECTDRTRATLVSFGERMSTRIFSSYLRSLGLQSRHFDAFDELGLITSDQFENGEIRDQTYSNIKAALHLEKDEPASIAVVTGFLGRGEKTGAITTLGRGGSDLTATVIGAALNLPEVQVWKDVDGVLSADPREVQRTIPMSFLSFQEATELAYSGAQVLHPQSMRPAMESDSLCVRVKNSYNIDAPGTLIGHARSKRDDWLLTSIVRKKNVTLLDIVSTRMLGQYGFLARVFAVMEKAGISVDCIATSEVSVSLTLDPAKLWSRDLVKEELDALVRDFEENGIARVSYSTGNSLISLIGNVERNTEIMERSFRALGHARISVKMISQGASKTNISLLVNESQGVGAVRAIHAEFFAPHQHSERSK